MLTKQKKRCIMLLESSERVNTMNYNRWENSHIFFTSVLENSEHINNFMKAGDNIGQKAKETIY